MNSSDNVVTELAVPPASQAVAADDPRLVEALEEYRALLEAGQKPDRQVYHPTQVVATDTPKLIILASRSPGRIQRQCY